MKLEYGTPIGDVQSKLIEVTEKTGIDNPQFSMVAEGKWRIWDQDTGVTLDQGEL